MTEQGYRRLRDGRWEKGTPDHVRFWAKVNKTEGCWEWLGYVKNTRMYRGRRYCIACNEQRSAGRKRSGRRSAVAA